MMPRTHCPWRAHPRSRGENGKVATSATEVQWLIPAHAGKTLQDIFDLVSAAAHPRSRGENLNAPLVSAPLTGSSPLTRGKPPHLRAFTCGGRLIPAHAGKTTTPLPSILSWWAHPRSRGENLDAIPHARDDLGSSPLTRGKPHTSALAALYGGLIPAHAGKTKNDNHVRWPHPAHPRSRGENEQGAPDHVWPVGSSPLTRGKPRHQARRLPACRLIPAHAGKTV